MADDLEERLRDRGELPVDKTSTREGLSQLSVLMDRVKANVEKNIAEREARGEPVVPPGPDRSAEHRGRLQRMADRMIPARAALVLAGGEGGGDPPDLATPAMQLAQEFMRSKPGTLGISGGVGCGKTIAAAWAVAQKVRDPYLGNHHDGRDGRWPADLHPRFIDAARLARLPRFSGKGEAQTAIGPYETCSILAIDDVGLENDDGFFGILDALIVARHENNLRTVITTNMLWEPFKAKYHERIADRLRGSGGFYELTGSSKRRS